MPQFDLPIAELRAYTPALEVPSDLHAFWAGTLAEARTHDLAVSCTLVDTGLTAVDTFDVAYAGYGGTRIRAWLHLPAGQFWPRGWMDSAGAEFAAALSRESPTCRGVVLELGESASIPGSA